MSAPSITPASAERPTLAKSRPRFRVFRLAFLLLILVLLAHADPDIFRFSVRHVCQWEAWRNGVALKIGQVESTLFEPLKITDSQWEYTSTEGIETRVEIAQIDANFDFRAPLVGKFDRWFPKLRLSKVSAKTVIPKATEVDSHPQSPWWKSLQARNKSWLPRPDRIEIEELEYVLENGPNSVRLEQTQISLSELEAGALEIGLLTIKQPWLERSFRNVHGTTARVESKFLLGNVLVEPGLEIRSFSANLAQLANVEPEIATQIEAFGGEILGQAKIESSGLLSFDATANFSRINIAKLATFLKLSDAAGGLIKEGKVTFHGSPQQLEKATTGLYLDATNFQWESRQWDSLALAASLMDRRVQISKLNLIQGHNRLELNGEMILPTPGVHWYQNEFTCNIAAQIDNLTELSALLLPEFKFAAGKAKVDGSIRGRNGNFNGQLIASGSQIKWRNAPVENLHAAIRLDGNECQVINLEVFNKGDYVRGSGVVTILGTPEYSGEFRASIEELATYAAILQKPLIPEPLAGGALIEWTGQGSSKGHTGKFISRLNKVRSLGAMASQLHPINIELDGHYAPGQIQFSKFGLSDDESSLNADVGVSDKALSFQKIRLTHGTKVVLEGAALLPLDVWQSWPNTSLKTLLNQDTVSEISLNATAIDLRKASQLAGWKFPVAGTASGILKASGSLKSLKTEGRITLQQGSFPLGWNGEILNSVEGDAAFAGQEIQLAQLTGRHRFGLIELSGSIGLQDLTNPELKLHAKSNKATLPLFQSSEIAAASSLDLNITGNLQNAIIQGKATLLSLHPGTQPDLGALWRGPRPSPLPSLFGKVSGPWNQMSLQVDCKSEQPVPLDGQKGTGHAELQITGTIGVPILNGSLKVHQLNAAANGQPLTIQEASAQFSPEATEAPSVDLTAHGILLGEEFSAFLAGPWNQLMRWSDPTPPLTSTLVEEALAGRPAPPDLELDFHAPKPFWKSVQVSDWQPIEDPQPLSSQ